MRESFSAVTWSFLLHSRHKAHGEDPDLMLTHYLLQMEISLRSVRDSTLTLTLLNLFLLLHGVSSDTEFEISVPTGVQMGVYGEAVHLSCVFPVSGSWDADSSVITWLHNLEVVHSFFHGQDQPQYQSQTYANRTSLFHQEMKKGNASLRLDRTTLEDAGEYTCSVSTRLGSQSKSFPLKVAAFYSEPRLKISLLSDGHMEVLVTSEGGFPSPSLQWLMGNTRDVTNHTHTQLSKDHHTGLYSVNSKLILNGTVNSSITFIMKNPDLDQTIRRSIDLFSENGGSDQRSQRAGLIVLSVVVVILLAVIISLIILRHRMMKKEKSRNPSESNIELSEASIHQTAAEKPLMDETESVTESQIKEDLVPGG
ncbi:CD276 antigen-like isoform X1 [Tachysurus vachellii]|uniref:CD276 antigen-like isoform X1 n=1 Tax=Tachysurus vachellii TaxID=175792 RepID=UPI00296AAEAD|nr:CD276 antigen-like isoform X1 [Tachysurus vachellii]